MHDLRIGQTLYRLSGSDCEIALAHAIGNAFIELQQLEFTIISYLDTLAGGGVGASASFDLFASKTFGNLIREMQKHALLERLSETMRLTKERRDFFVHKFLFHRFGGALFTSECEYEALIKEAHDAGALFADTHCRFDEHMLARSQLVMFAGRVDPDTGELTIVESEFAKTRRQGGG
jgi:hypothetical protein